MQHLEKSIGDIFYLIKNDPESINKLPKIKFGEFSELARIVGLLTSQISETEVTAENIDTIKEKLTEALKSGIMTESHNEINRLINMLASSIGKAREEFKHNINDKVRSLYASTYDKYQKKLISDGHEDLLNLDIEPSTEHLRIVDWSWLNSEDYIFKAHVDTVFEACTIASKNIDNTSMSILSSKLGKVLSVKHLSGIDKTLSKNLESLDKEVFTSIEPLISVLCSESQFKNLVMKYQKWMSNVSKDTAEHIIEAIDTVKKIEVFISLVPTALNEIDEDNQIAVLSNLNQFKLLSQSIQIYLSYLKDKVYKDKAILTKNTINGDAVQALKEKHGDSYLTHIVKFLRYEDNIPATGRPVSELLNDLIQTKVAAYEKDIQDKGNVIKRKAIEFAFFQTAIENMEQFISKPSNEISLEEKNMYKRQVNEYVTSLKGTPDNLDKVIYEMCVNYHPNAFVKKVYSQFNSGYAQLTKSAESSIDDVSYKLTEVEGISEMITSHLMNFVTK